MSRPRRARGDGAVTIVTAASPPTGEQRELLRREWVLADRELFGGDVDWTSVSLTIQARAGGAVVGLAAGEVIAGMARLHDLLVVPGWRGRGVGRRLVREFCARAAVLGAGRCFLRCPATERHRRFYERLRFRQVALVPRYYHGMDFLEYMREPLP